ncbi:N-acetylmuramoyl-L-alanine amidase [Sulfitobacter geojensis]|uniref:N-acetylmuramoyl-L-alanine amidase n=1 Tax=Sulfitobacter geojensis TaxID=1342299 RepID=A0AAE3B5T0_9RHOB|nr:N-acetylmuramoyl-L-alanine amidase [Sulfitobacter geojensis]MBM1688459.1 N-acetylmuramoyl-L-alanine amidase [Sulfitobacter geojensis]MBM1692526.1 N-acetylmuramoyl-L-alanine amidase [Sulfitobacter geojensis]MBM1704692.1 N-acetylmuramoyl-L-alanine amidase [Sulfitobacter geojensis]MBM1708750.1 N-acetylmuramoyl-L-alanine amidase [Sulfitobacter geojensis]MBM1712815.1 N-acetylmuramoyl-L-alanine amidase [Sulfitobacter geojensis]
MRAFFYLAMFLGVWASAATAQDLSALARVDPAKSSVSDGWFGKTEIKIGLSQGVPFRVFLLENPARLVVDFKEADWATVRPDMILPQAGRVSAVRFGAFRPGWSRLVADLSEPLVPVEVGMPVDAASGQAVLEITLKTASPEEFTAQAGAPVDPAWPEALTKAPETQGLKQKRFTVALDAGHGGIDPGAERGDVLEKDLMLSFARTLREVLLRNDVDVVMIRDEDVFVALETRVAIAHQARADIFISLHADSLRQGGAKGATVYTLSKEASDAATAHLAARHDRSDIIAGADLTGSDDQVAGILLDLARQETEPRSLALAKVLAEGMAQAGGPMNRRPLRKAGFSVLKSADIPSVLVEVGFLSSDRDLKNLRDPVWRNTMVNGMAQAILTWRDNDAARAPLVRQ